MSQNRSDRQGPGLAATTPIVVETMRQCAESGKDAEKDDGRMPLFWRVFGGTVLSITALVVMNAYQGLSGGLAELRAEIGQLSNEMRKEVNRLSEAHSELVPQDEMDARMRAMGRSVRELQEDRKELTALKERCRGLVAQTREAAQARRQLHDELNQVFAERAGEQERQALLHELAGLRERVAGVEGRHSAVRASQ